MPILLVGGGSRSGKSRHALELARRFGPRRGFLATAQAFDDEMRDRIQKHQAERADEFLTIEEPLDLTAALHRIESKLDVLIVDCLTLWLSNLMLSESTTDTTAVLDAFAASPLPSILVTNEVGCGIVPENALARQFRDRAGILNQQAVARATEAYWMIFGVPLRLNNMRQALQFLTVIPISAPATPPGQSAWAFAIVGALLGLLAAALHPLPFGPLLTIIVLANLTGGLHEDGLADVADAIRAYRSREKMLAILKDSRIGAHGALALIASFTFRWQALAMLQTDVWWRLPAAYGFSRTIMVLLASTTPATGEGLGRAFTASLPRYTSTIAVLQLTLLAALTRYPAALVLLGANLLALAILRAWFLRRLGGITGDCLGAACQLSEAVSLGVLACV